MTQQIPLKDYTYDYTDDLIATTPANPRDSSRLLIINRQIDQIIHSTFSELPQFLSSGDCLVLNRTKVSPCRLIGQKITGGKIDMLLLKEIGPKKWTVLSSGLKIGQKMIFSQGLEGQVEELNSVGEYIISFNLSDIKSYLSENGFAPLPPYIAKKILPAKNQVSDYQTIYARDLGSIAAPTAGLHFTDSVFKHLKMKGVQLAWITLHVGRGTFKPITDMDAANHQMLPEYFEVESSEAERMQTVLDRGGRLIAVGTTVTRTLETLALQHTRLRSSSGESSLYIYPGFNFKIVKGLITNFHLPYSTPLLLASAFAGRKRLLSAYQEAVREKYRLFSFGDATLIL